MADWSKQNAEVAYEWNGLKVRTVVSIPHGRDGSEAISFLTRLVDGLSDSYNRAQREGATVE